MLIYESSQLENRNILSLVLKREVDVIERMEEGNIGRCIENLRVWEIRDW